MSRAIPFKGVYEGIVSRLGLDPTQPVPHNLYQAIPRNLTKEVRTAWTYWEWPYIEVCDERAFQRIWNDYEQFAASEKVIFIRNMLYYQAKPGDPGTGPPIGALPTDPLYWDPLEDYGNLILFDQICRRPMGMTIGVYPSDPRAKNCSCDCGLDYRPADNGIEVLGGHGPSVFVKYQLPVPEFTLTPYAPGRSYVAGNKVYHALTGECYLAVADSNGVEPPAPASWLKIDFPDFLADYVVAATYAACIKETSQAVAEDPEQQKMRLVLSKDAKDEAEEALVGEIDKLRAMGQRYRYCAWRRPTYTVRPPPGVCLSEPFDPTGGTLPPELAPPVTTLSEICETDATAAPPALEPGLTWRGRAEIKKLRTSDPTPEGPSLSGLATKGALALGAVVQIVIEPGPGVMPQEQSYRLDPLAADPDDPGHVTPDDWDPAYNNVHWTRVG
jgi:hypothetical protein